MLVLAPASVQEMASLVFKGFDLADKYRMTTMILADGTMGQMMEPVSLDMGEVKNYDKPWAVTGTKGERTHNIVNSLSLLPEELEQWNIRRYEMYRRIEETEAMYEEFMTEDADVVVVAFGVAARVARNAIVAAREKGIKAGMIRPITLWPFPEKVMQKAAKTASCFLSVEMSMGQMVDDVRLAVNGEKPVYFFGRTGGIIPSPAEVLGEIQKIMGGAK